MLVGPGENAGVIDAGDGIAIAIRIESHNHPSAIEPYQGAATGVGGILRDIFTMGARPLAIMDPLFFGPPDDARQRWLMEGVVSGISGYGNSVGVPTVGGELTFDPCYAQNPLVNVLCMGRPADRPAGARHRLGRREPGRAARQQHRTRRHRRRQRAGLGRLRRSTTAGGTADDTKRPSVQVGDPFEEKRLIEACLELLDRSSWWGSRTWVAPAWPAPPARRPAGAGSAWTSTSPPCRGAKQGMEPWEVMTSESQERMLAIVTPESWAAVADDLRQVGGPGDRRGQGDRARPRGRRPPAHPRRLRRPDPGRRPGRLALRRRPALRPAAPAPGRRWRSVPLAPPEDCAADLLGLLRSPRWVFRQYDHQLFLNTVVGPGGDAALLRLAGPGLPASDARRGGDHRLQSPLLRARSRDWARR